MNDDDIAARRRKRQAETDVCDLCDGSRSLDIHCPACTEIEDDIIVHVDPPPLVRVKLLSPTAKAPQYMTAGAAGADVFADLSRIPDGDAHFGPAWGGDCSVGPGGLWCVTLREGTARVPLGFAVEIPAGWVGLLKGRSGEARRGNDAHVAYIDSDYRGECSILIHVGRGGIVVKNGDRVGQVAFMPAPQVRFELAEELSDTARGQGGFGHTGSR